MVIDRSEARDNPYNAKADKGRRPVWNSRSGNHLGPRSCAAAHSEAGHMIASDRFKLLPSILQAGGRPHMQNELRRSARLVLPHIDPHPLRLAGSQNRSAYAPEPPARRHRLTVYVHVHQIFARSLTAVTLRAAQETGRQPEQCAWYCPLGTSPFFSLAIPIYEKGITALRPSRLKRQQTNLTSASGTKTRPAEAVLKIGGYA